MYPTKDNIFVDYEKNYKIQLHEVMSRPLLIYSHTKLDPAYHNITWTLLDSKYYHYITNHTYYI